MRILVTGGAGFIGSNLVRMLLRERPRFEITNLDLLTYAGNIESLADLQEHPRHTFLRADICDADAVRSAMQGVDLVLHLAAESHVDRSIASDAPFVRTNVLGTQTLLSAALAGGVQRFVQVSTDEVYGELPWSDPDKADPAVPRFTEDTPLAPRSPYSASKAAADLLALAYHTTHGMDVVVTRCSNNYGPFQFPEKLIPLMITHAVEGRPLPVYGDGLQVRDWIHVDDHCRGILAAAEQGRAGRVYNFGGDAERTNLAVVRAILERIPDSGSAIEHVTDRKGHDRRYAIEAARAREDLGWYPRWNFEDGMDQTVAWYLEHAEWWQRVKSGAYWDTYARLYGTPTSPA